MSLIDGCRFLGKLIFQAELFLLLAELRGSECALFRFPRRAVDESGTGLADKSQVKAEGGCGVVR